MNNSKRPTDSATWIGRLLSTLVVLVLLADGLVDLVAPGKVAAEMLATGFPLQLAAPLGIMILVCALVYAIPATSVAGAILVTGFAGGAICTHFRLGEMGSAPQIISALIAIAAWGGLWLRFPAVRELLPMTRH
jgi:hypothetical protein